MTRHIRPATEDDIDALASISKASLAYAWSRQDFLDSIRNPQARIFLMEASGNRMDPVIAGYAVLYFAADEGEVTSVGVLPAVRRQGIGSAIMRELIAQSAALGVRSLYLEVRESNLPAQKLYASLGFAQVGIRPQFYESPREDAYIMKKSND